VSKHGRGQLVIHPPSVDSGSVTPGRITFTAISDKSKSENPADSDPTSRKSVENSGHLSISINDIVGIKKEGLNWPARIFTSLALDAEGAGGTGIALRVIRRDGSAGSEASHLVAGEKEVTREETINMTGIVRRDELFDRLIALGDQRWEVL